MQTEKQNIVIAILVGSAFVFLFGFITLLVVINYVRRKRKILIERQIRESQFRQELLQAQLEMQDHTFKAVSQEIHDNVGQILSLVKLNLNIIMFERDGNETLHTIKGLVTEAISELRNLSAGYYADRLVEEGLLVAIQHQLAQLNKTGLFTTTFHSDCEILAVDKSKIIFLYRMIQEVLNNVVKHSGADHVSVYVYSKGDEVSIQLEDNGKGFNKSRSDLKPGIGLSSIQQRALMIGAKADINSKEGSGTIVNLVFNQNGYDQNRPGR